MNIKNAIEEGKKAKIIYEVVLVEKKDFVIRKKSERKSEIFVANFEKKQFYIKNEKTNKINNKLTANAIETFFKNCSGIPELKNDWISCADEMFLTTILPKVITTDILLIAVNKGFTQIDIMLGIGNQHILSLNTRNSYFLSIVLNFKFYNQQESFDKMYELYNMILGQHRIYSPKIFESIFKEIVCDRILRNIFMENIEFEDDIIKYFLYDNKRRRIYSDDQSTKEKIYLYYFNLLMSLSIKRELIDSTDDLDKYNQDWREIIRNRNPKNINSVDEVYGNQYLMYKRIIPGNQNQEFFFFHIGCVMIDQNDLNWTMTKKKVENFSNRGCNICANTCVYGKNEGDEKIVKHVIEMLQ